MAAKTDKPIPETAQEKRHRRAEKMLREVPHSPAGAQWGPDDFLVTNGVAALSDVLSKASPANPKNRVAGLAALSDSHLSQAVSALLDDLLFLLSIAERGEGTARDVASVLSKYGVTRKVFDKAVGRATKALSAAQRHKKAPGVSTLATIQSGYEIQDGRFVILKTSRDGSVAIPLTNFVAEIAREVVLDDDLETRRMFEVSGTTEQGLALPTVQVAPAELGQETWPLKLWGAGVVVAAMSHVGAHLRNAVQAHSEPSTAHIYTHLGFRLVGEKRVFLHAGGAIGDATVEVQVRDKVARYLLPPVALNVAESTRLVLRLLHVAGWDVGFFFIAIVFRAPLQSLIYCDVVPWLVGETGSMKTAIAVLLLCFFGQFDAEHLPASWGDTPTAIEEILFRAKDVLVVIDDFAPMSAEPFDPVRKLAAVVLRAIANRAPRQRSRADLSSRPARPPRGLALATGEDLPNGTSILARLFPVEIKRENVDIAVVSELQPQTGRFPHVMRAYLEYVCAYFDSLGEWARRRFLELRAQAQKSGAHLRSPAAVAHMTLGAEMFALFCQHVGALSAEESAAFARDAFAALTRLGSLQQTTTAESDPIRRFLDVLRGLMAQGEVHLVPRELDGVSDEDRGLADSVRAAHLRQVQDELERRQLPRTPKVPIGWVDSTRAYLQPGATFRAVSSAMRASGAPLELKERTLWGRLRDRGLILVEERDHLTVKRPLGGRSVRVILMDRAVLENVDTYDCRPGPAARSVAYESGSAGGESGSFWGEPGSREATGAPLSSGVLGGSQASLPGYPGYPGSEDGKTPSGGEGRLSPVGASTSAATASPHVSESGRPGVPGSPPEGTNTPNATRYGLRPGEEVF